MAYQAHDLTPKNITSILFKKDQMRYSIAFLTNILPRLPHHRREHNFFKCLLKKAVSRVANLSLYQPSYLETGN